MNGPQGKAESDALPEVTIAPAFQRRNGHDDFAKSLETDFLRFHQKRRE